MSEPTPVFLQFTDRSRLETRLGRCPRAAFLSTVFGPSGYGIQRKKTSVPLVSGTMLHDGMSTIMQYIYDKDQLPPDDVVDDAVVGAHNKYDLTFAARGIQYWEEGDEAMLRHVEEQKLLIEGLIWCFVLEKLPLLHQEYEVIAVEQEEVTILGCTCGIGDGIPPWREHAANNCTGIGLQTKADWIGKRRQGSDHFTYHEFKTFGQYPNAFAAQWDTKIQPYIGAYGWSKRTGITISGTYVHGLYKGRREREKLPTDRGRTYTGPEYQNSKLCYGYYNPGMPPAIEPDWQLDYSYIDGKGQSRRLTSAYRKTLLSTYRGGVKAWVENHPEIRAEQLMSVGPLLPRPTLVDATIRAWRASEEAEVNRRWDFLDVMEQHGFDWSHPEVQTFLDISWPRSWQCANFGPKHKCEFVPICFEQAGWQDPLTFMDYILRRPHHEPELEQAIARGLLLPEDMGEEDED